MSDVWWYVQFLVLARVVIACEGVFLFSLLKFCVSFGAEIGNVIESRSSRIWNGTGYSSRYQILTNWNWNQECWIDCQSFLSYSGVEAF